MAAEDLRVVLKEEPHNTPAIVSGGHFDCLPVVFLITRGDSFRGDSLSNCVKLI